MIFSELYSAYYNGIFDLDSFDTSSVKNISSIFMFFSSDTLKFSNKDLKNIENNIIDTNLEGQSHITGDLLDIKNKIDGKTSIFCSIII